MSRGRSSQGSGSQDSSLGFGQRRQRIRAVWMIGLELICKEDRILRVCVAVDGSAFACAHVNPDQRMSLLHELVGDGINDVFKVSGLTFQNMVEFRVFNRWGQELFYTNSKDMGWDGAFHGEKQDMGVYNYLIIVDRPGQDNIIYKGSVTLLR